MKRKLTYAAPSAPHFAHLCAGSVSSRYIEATAKAKPLSKSHRIYCIGTQGTLSAFCLCLLSLPFAPGVPDTTKWNLTTTRVRGKVQTERNEWNFIEHPHPPKPSPKTPMAVTCKTLVCYRLVTIRISSISRLLSFPTPFQAPYSLKTLNPEPTPFLVSGARALVHFFRNLCFQALRECPGAHSGVLLLTCPCQRLRQRGRGVLRPGEEAEGGGVKNPGYWFVPRCVTCFHSARGGNLEAEAHPEVLHLRP